MLTISCYAVELSRPMRFATMLLVAAVTEPQAASIVPPSFYENTHGTVNSYPFFGYYGAMQYQQVFPASDWGDLSSVYLINRLTLRSRRDISTSGDQTTLPHVEISLSSTSRGYLELDRQLRENIGPDNVTVYSAPLTLISTPTAELSAVPHETIIDFQRPFPYRPGDGNLLLQVITERGIPKANSFGFDAIYHDSIPSSRVFDTDWNIDELGLSQATVAGQKGGLIAKFSFVEIPEPTSLATLGAVLAISVASMGRSRCSDLFTPPC